MFFIQFSRLPLCQGLTTALSKSYGRSDFNAICFVIFLLHSCKRILQQSYEFFLLLSIKGSSFRGKALNLNGCGNSLSSHVVTNIVFSALVSLTSVFGMRTGGSSPPLSPQWYIYCVSAGHILPFTVESQLHRKYISLTTSLSTKSDFFFSSLG